MVSHLASAKRKMYRIRKDAYNLIFMDTLSLGNKCQQKENGHCVYIGMSELLRKLKRLFARLLKETVLYGWKTAKKNIISRAY